jgi:hypothetical protein
MMEKPWTPSAAATAGHVSEQPLPAEWFSVHLANDSGFADLHRQIDVALAAA